MLQASCCSITLVLLALLLPLTSPASISISDYSNTTVSATNNLNLTLNRDTSNSASSITCNFPTGFDLSGVTAKTGGQSSTKTMGATNNIITLPVTAGMTSTALLVELAGVKNPGYVVSLNSANFNCTVASTGATETVPMGTPPWFMTAGSLKDCQMSFLTVVNSRSGTLDVQLQLGNNIPAGSSQIVLGFQTQWSGISGNSPTRYGALQPNSTSIVSLSSLSATITSPTTTTNSYPISGLSGNGLTINFSNSDIPSDSWINFKLTGVSTPPLETLSTSSDNISVSVRSYLGEVDSEVQCTVVNTPVYEPTCTVTSTGAKVASALNLSISIGNLSMNEIGLATDSIEIVFPTGVTYPLPNTLVMTPTTGSQFGTSTSTRDLPNLKQTFTTLRDFSNPTTNFFSSVNIGYTLNLVSNITLPASASPLNFTVTFYRSSVRYMTCKAELAAIATGALGMSLLALSSNVVGGTASYTIALTTTNNVPSTGGFIVTFPSVIGISGFTTCTLTTSTSSQTPLCTVISNTISCNLTADMPSGTSNITFSPLTNPLSSVSSLTFSASTYNLMSNLTTTIDSITSFTNTTTFNAATMQATVTMSNCDGFTGELCTLEVKGMNVVETADTTLVKVVVPSDMVFKSAVNLKACDGSVVTTVNDSTLDSVTYKVGKTCLAGDNITVYLTVLIANKTGTTNSLQLVYTTSTYLPIQSQTNTLNLSVSSPSSFPLISVSPDPTVTTGQTGYVDVIFKPNITHPIHTIISINFSAITGWTATCDSKCNVVSASTNPVVLNLTAEVAAGTVYTMRVGGMIYPRSLKSVAMTVKSSLTFGSQEIQKGEPDFTVVKASTLTTAYASRRYWGSTQPIILSITLANQFIVGDTLKLTISGTVYPNITSPTCTPSTFSCTFTNGGLSISVSAIQPYTPSTSISLTLSGYQANNFGTEATSNAITVSHFDASQKLCSDDSASPLAYSLTCPVLSSSQLLCQTCNSDTSSCLSCYPASQGITGNIYLKSNTCTNNCSSVNQYYVSGVNCQQCMSPCATCQNLTFCYTCVSTSQFLYSNNSCYATCSSGAYGSGIASYNTTINSVLRCFPCDSTCSSCNDSNYCLYCTNPSLIANLLTGQCVSTCPDGYYNNSGQCFKCGSTCGNCSNSFSCLTCIDSLVYSLTSTNQCVENCPGQVPVGGVCMCGTDCVNCSGTVTNCVSCVSGRLLQGSDCVSSCSGAAYSSNGVCYSCPMGCAACTASACSSCNSNYYFLNGACHDDCPSSLGSGYVNNPSNQSCEKCTAGCSMCDPQNLSNCSSCLANYSFNPVTRLCQTNASTVTTLCVSGYTLKDGVCVVDEATVAGKVTVVLYTLALVGWSAFGLLSKILAKQVYLQYAMASGLSLFEVTVYMVVIGFTAQAVTSSRRLLVTTSSLTWSGTICLIVSLALNYLLNFAHLWIYFKYLVTDTQFPKNKKKPRQKNLNIFLLVVSTLTNFRFYQIVFSSLCGYKLFKTRLQFTSKLLPINLLNCCMIVVSTLALAGFGLICADSVSSQSQYYGAIIGIVITVFAVIFTLASFHKEEDFFETVCKYEASDAISNTEEGLDAKGEEYHFGGSKMQTNYKILNEASLVNLNEEAGDLPIAKKNSGINDPLRPISLKGVGGGGSAIGSAIVLDQSEIQEAGADGQEAHEGQAASSQGELPVRKTLRKKFSRLEDKSRSVLRIDEPHQEEKVQTIINDLTSNISSMGKADQSILNQHKKGRSAIQVKADSPGRKSPDSKVSGRKSPGSQLTPGRKSPQIQKPSSQSPPRGQNSKTQNPDQTAHHINQSNSQGIAASDSKLIQIKPKAHNSAQHLQISSQTHSQQLLRRQPIDLNFIQKFYHEGTYQFSEPEIQYNEISPSQFNIENQRFDEQAFRIKTQPSEQAARSTPLKNFTLQDLKKDFD